MCHPERSEGSFSSDFKILRRSTPQNDRGVFCVILNEVKNLIDNYKIVIKKAAEFSAAFVIRQSLLLQLLG